MFWQYLETTPTTSPPSPNIVKISPKHSIVWKSHEIWLTGVYLAVELGPEHGEDADVLLHGLGQLVGGLLRRGVAQVDAVIL